MGKHKAKKIGFIAGILLLFLITAIPTPEGLSVVGQRVLAVTVLMVVFWMTEAMPIAFTALLPILLFPLLNITGTKGQNGITLFGNYAYSTCYLVLAVGILSGAMIRHDLHKRLAFAIVSRIGKKPTTMVLGFILAVAFVSMWMSNTTAAVMMLPVALAIASALGEESSGLKKALVLSIPYAATIGGMSTIIGTTTNPTGVGLIRDMLSEEITFLEWLKIGLPFTIVLVPVFWLYMIRFFHVDKMEPFEINEARRQYLELGPISRGAKYSALIFQLCILLWVTRSLLWGKWFPFATDETVAMFGAFLTMAVPTDYREGEYVLDWKTALESIPWNGVLLLGGSMTMGIAFKDAGCAAWVAEKLHGLSGMNPVLIIIVVGVLSSLMTELTTNAVVVAAFLPVLGSIGIAVGVSPLAMMLACMMASNFAFMMPPATPPNAIAYGTGEIEMSDMIRCGFGLKLIAILLFPLVLNLITFGLFHVGM